MTPRSQKKKFNPAYSKELLRIAVGDLQSAAGLYKVKEGRPENICFHCHQAIEKSIKAVLVFKGIAIPLIHNIGVLLASLPDDLEIPFSYKVQNLDEFSAIRCYEEGKAPLADDELKAALEVAKKAIEWAEQQVGKG